MKNIFKYIPLTFILAVLLVSPSCSDSDDVDDITVKLSVAPSVIANNGTSAAVFTVEVEGVNVTSNAIIFNVDTKKNISGASFTSTEIGTYKFQAQYNNVLSNIETVEVMDEAEVGRASFSASATGDIDYEWKQGNEIGIFMIKSGEELSSSSISNGANNRKFITGAGKTAAMTPAAGDQQISYPENGTVDFIAYHPFRKSDELDGFRYSVDLSDQSDPDAVTVMYSNNAKNKSASSGSVGLEFSHALAKIVLDFSYDSSMDVELIDGMVVDFIGLPVQGEVNLIDGLLSVDNLGSNFTAFEVEATKKYQAIVFPTEDEYDPERGMIATLSVYGEYSASFHPDLKLEAGKVYTFPLTFSRNGELSMGPYQVEDWDGKDDIPEKGVVVPDGYMAALKDPNSYAVKPGNSVSIPVKKAYAVWTLNEILQESSDRLAGSVTASVVWQDVEGLLSNSALSVSGEGDDAVITVNTNAVKGEGNALIGVHVGGVLRWSWHLWITEYNPDEAVSQKHYNGITFMDRNLGAMGTTPKDPKAIGLYYQWGRKDPFHGYSNWSYPFIWKKLWDGEDAEVDIKAQFTATENVLENFSLSIKEPYKFIDASKDWMQKGSDVIVRDHWCNDDGSKGYFDPCPQGWRIPNKGTGTDSPWAGITAGDLIKEHGFSTDELGYYPSVGCRFSSSMITEFDDREYDASGYYHQHGTLVKNRWENYVAVAMAYGYWSNLLFTTERSIAQGLQVRCVKE